jgi:hypothetical protein
MMDAIILPDDAPDAAAAAPPPSPVAPAPPSSVMGIPITGPSTSETIQQQIDTLRAGYDREPWRWGAQDTDRLAALHEQLLAAQDREAGAASTEAARVALTADVALGEGRAWDAAALAQAQRFAAAEGVVAEAVDLQGALAGAVLTGRSYSIDEGRAALAMSGDPEQLVALGELTLDAADALGFPALRDTIEKAQLENHPGVIVALARVGEKLLASPRWVQTYVEGRSR